MFDWGTQCLEGRKLCYDLPGQEPFVEPFQQVGPGSNASVQHVDSMHCLLTVQTGTPRSPITRAVQAATAVAVGGIPIPKRVSTLHPTCMMTRLRFLRPILVVQYLSLTSGRHTGWPLVICIIFRWHAGRPDTLLQLYSPQNQLLPEQSSTCSWLGKIGAS